ncbi:MAG: hypothetical protein MI802_21210, partial [Desulfobacterales bacterium]|nr:hypothetical protein [Desulfobacterales bacterium]
RSIFDISTFEAYLKKHHTKYYKAFRVNWGKAFELYRAGFELEKIAWAMMTHYPADVIIQAVRLGDFAANAGERFSILLNSLQRVPQAPTINISTVHVERLKRSVRGVK